MALLCCLPVSTTLLDCVPATFKKHSCHLSVSCHPLILHNLFVVDLYEQYVHGLTDVLDRHVPLVSGLTKPIWTDSADWLSDSYRHAKSLKCEFEIRWHRAKNSLNRSRLYCQIAQYNALVNSDYYNKLISDNSQDSRKLWHVLCKTLNRVPEVTLPSHESDKSLADQFASFFLNKIKTIRDTFVPSGTEYDVHPPSEPQKITTFTQVY